MTNSVVMVTPRRAATSVHAALSLSITLIAARASMSRMSVVESHAGGNAVDGAGEDFANADGSDGIDGACRFCGGFKSQDQFCCCCQRIFAAGHQLAAGMTAFAFDHDALAGGRGDVRDEADVDAFLFEDRVLARCAVR